MLSLQIYESVFNRGPACNYLFSPTPTLTILAVNDALLRACSRSREELVGVGLFEAFPGNPNDPKDSGESALRHSIERVITTGIAHTMPVQRYPIAVVHANGQVGYEERFWSAANTPIFDLDGTLLCISHTTIDITDKVRSDAALRESENRLRSLIHATADVVYRMNPDWTQMYQLDGRGFIKDADDAQPFVISDYVFVDDRALVQSAIDVAVRNSTVFRLEHRVIRADGSCGWTYSKAVPMRDGRGNIYEWIGAASDITDRRLAEEKLKDASRRKDEFLAMLAHELRNPLAPISAAAQMLQIAKRDEDRVHHTSLVIDRQVKHMTSLIDDLLDVSRVTRGLDELDTACVDIMQVITDAVEQVAPLIKAHRHQLALSTSPHLPKVMGDKKRLVQVLVNLLNNAAKYTPDGGTIAVNTEVCDAQVMITIIDNGVGMAPELLSSAFDLFSQAQRSSDRSSGGLGLGLALVKSLVELHHGTIVCDSAGAGKGTRFLLRLPCVEASDQACSEQPLRSLPAAATSLRVMVVDDNEDAATMLAMLLEATGYEVLTEYSSHQALAHARIELPRVFLLDIGLPDMDGNELAKQLRAEPQTADAVLIAVTGYGQDTDRARTRAAGFDHHLVKPIDSIELLQILADIDC